MTYYKKLGRCALALGLLSLMAGCGGFSGSHSVSPATFFMPGIGQQDPPQPIAPVQAPSSAQLAKSNY